jgi:hypothetical protein
LLAAALLSAGAAAGATDPADLARELVAAQVGVPAGEVRILGVTARAFPDGSLDCPVPGMAYAQVITPGHQVSAEAAGRRFDVRVAGSSARICHGLSGARQRPGRAAPTERRATVAQPAVPAADRARSQLASLLGIPVDAVTVLDTHPRGPKEALPGCGAAPPAAGDGVLILGADGRQYTWLVRGGLATPCPPLATR